MVDLALALTAFVGTHFLMSHPLRALMVAALGVRGQLIAYVLVSFATLGWASSAFKRAPLGLPLWDAGTIGWALGTLLMLAGSILFAGSLIGNPALPNPGGATMAAKQPGGVLAITRHPMMWSFACWSANHALVSPRPPVLLLTFAIAFLALVGAAGQDAKKRGLMGEAWAAWVGRTAFVPFAGQVAGRIGWGAIWPGWGVLLGGIGLWLLATWVHPYAGAGIVAGIWRWL